MEAIRIIKEMRVATDGKYPRFAIFENVTGAFSSGTPRGEDFRIVLEEFVKIAQPCATMPAMPGGKWPYADSYVGNGWSISYRTFDTQYWPRTPQRRKRLYLVADFGGECAHKILFEREGLRGDFAQSKNPWQGASADVGGSAASDDRERNIVSFHLTQDPITNQRISHCVSSGNPRNGQAIVGICYPVDNPFNVENTQSLSAGFKAGNSATSRGIGWEEERSPTLLAGNSGTNRTPAICIRNGEFTSTYDTRGNGNGEIVNTITGDHESRVTDYTSVIVEHMAFAQNMRDELRDLKGRTGALAANHGMKQ